MLSALILCQHKKTRKNGAFQHNSREILDTLRNVKNPLELISILFPIICKFGLTLLLFF